MSTEAEESAIAPYVDSAFYLDTYADVRTTGGDAVQHYARNGWREGRDPNSWFCTQEYLRLHRDVAKADVNPLWHYITTGRKEGRPLRLAAEALDWDQIDEETLDPFFDPAHYSKQAGVKFATREEALTHFVEKGDLALLDAHPQFSAEFYHMNYLNSKFVTGSPLKHYIEIGRAKGFPPNPQIQAKADRIDGASPAREQTKRWLQHRRPNILSAETLRQSFLKRLNKKAKKAFVSVSHDDFIDNVGGIQLCIARELQQAQERNEDYIHIAPFQSLLHMADPCDLTRFAWLISVNGKQLGCALASDVIQLLKSQRETSQARWVTTIHHIIGHTEEAIIALSDALNSDETYYWLHDYFFACEQFNLLRNDYAFCGAPAPSSTACELCAHGPARAAHLTSMKHIFEKLNPHVLAPSQSIVDTWERVSKHKHKALSIVPHCKPEYNNQSWDIGADTSKARPIRIAYLGNPNFIKGWPIFKTFMWALSGDERYEFIHLGIEQSELPDLLYAKTQVSPEDPNAMIDALRKHLVDVVFIWPLCRETFSLVTAEAIAAGALVMTNSNSGNTSALAEKHDRAIVFDTLNEAIVDCVSGDFQDTVFQAMTNGLAYGSLDFSEGLTVSYDAMSQNDPKPTPKRATNGTSKSSTKARSTSRRRTTPKASGSAEKRN